MDSQIYEDARPAFLTYAAAAALTGLSASSIRRLAARGDFPKPVDLLPRRPAFSAEEVERWCAERLAKREAVA